MVKILDKRVTSNVRWKDYPVGEFFEDCDGTLYIKSAINAGCVVGEVPFGSSYNGGNIQEFEDNDSITPVEVEIAIVK